MVQQLIIIRHMLLNNITVIDRYIDTNTQLLLVSRDTFMEVQAPAHEGLSHSNPVSTLMTPEPQVQAF